MSKSIQLPSWDDKWDKVFRTQEWGKYTPEELIRLIARNFYNVKQRTNIKFLEVGCGTGANCWYLAREGFNVCKGFVHFYKLSEIRKLFKTFKIISIEKVERTENNRRDKVIHWLVTCEK